jgi:hypothetical protein
MGTETPYWIEPEYLIVDEVAHLTGRNPQVIRKLIRDELIPSIQDPEDGRRRLVPDTAIPAIMRMRQEGTVTKAVTFTRSNGSTIVKRIRVRKEGS